MRTETDTLLDIMTCLKKLHADLKDLNSGEYTHISAAPQTKSAVDPETGTIVEEMDWYQWNATIVGPPDTPYENGVFRLIIQVTAEYPMKSPIVKFTTPIFHPNIGDSGMICLDILKNRWSPALGLARTLISIASLLADPNPTDPYNPKAAKLYLDNKAEFDRVARQYTLQYAS